MTILSDAGFVKLYPNFCISLYELASNISFNLDSPTLNSSDEKTKFVGGLELGKGITTFNTHCYLVSVMLVELFISKIIES